MSAGTTTERIALLNCAFDHGITHFDTAAYYGYGEAERLLGKFLEGKRDKVTVTTKFGIEPSGAARVRWINLLARRLFKALPISKKILNLRRGGQSVTTGAFEPEKARASLERSLLALQTDYIDLFLLHEPSPENAASSRLIQWLEEEVSRGRINAYGCGGEFQNIESIRRTNLPTGKWLQFEDNAINRNLDRIQPNADRCITFAPFNSALKQLVVWLSEHPQNRSAWSARLDIDCQNQDNLAALLQASSHQRNHKGILLFSTAHKERIKKAATIAAEEIFSPEQIQDFLTLTLSVSS